MEESAFKKHEVKIWVGISLLAAAIRLVQLGQPQLSSAEAAIVMPALELANHTLTTAYANTAYTLLTALGFTLFDATTFLARLFPAICGTLLVLSPLLFRKYLSDKTALVIGILLALDPALIHASRQAGSVTFALLCTVLAVCGFLSCRWYLLAGSIVGVLIGGPASWTGLVITVVALLALRLITPFDLPMPESVTLKSKSLRGFLIAVIAVMTVFFIFPSGLGSVGEGIAKVFSQQVDREPIGLLPLLFLLLVSQPIGVIIGLAEVVSRGHKSKTVLFLMDWTLVALLLIIVLPNRSQGSLVWLSFPFVVLAGMRIGRWVDSMEGLNRYIVILALTELAFLVFIWLRVLSINSAFTSQASPWLLALSILLPILLIVGISLVFSWWIGPPTAVNGVNSGLLLATLIWTVSSAWHATGLPENGKAYIWREGAVALQERDLATTLEQLSTWQTREGLSIPILAEDLEVSSIRWILRNFEDVEYGAVTSDSASFPIILTRENAIFPDAANYRGQTFIFSESYPLNDMTPVQWFRWITLREIPKQESNLVLWARSALFPDGAANP